MAWFRCMGGNGGVTIPSYLLYETVYFNSQSVQLPYGLDEDYDIFVDFAIPTYYNNMPIIGTTKGGTYLHLTQYSNKWYSSTGTAETNFTANVTGRHTFQINHDGKGLFDGNEVITYTPTTISNTPLTIGSRSNTSVLLRGYIYEYKITSISSGDVIADYVPAYSLNDGRIGLYNKINNTFLAAGSQLDNYVGYIN